MRLAMERLPREVADAVAAGRVVVANLSRRSLTEAAHRFRRLVVVEITALRPILVARIAVRGRETPSEIEACLARQVDLEIPSRAPGLLRIDNSGAPAIGADTIVRHLIAYAGKAHASR